MRVHFAFMLVSMLGFAGASTAGHPPDVASAAHRFSNAAEHLHRQLHRTPGHVHEAIDSHRLASAAEHFHGQVEHGGSRRHLGHDFEELRDAYEHLKHQVSRTGVLYRHRHVRDDYEAMHRAFHNLEASIDVARHGYRGYRGYRSHNDYGRRDSMMARFLADRFR